MSTYDKLAEAILDAKESSGISAFRAADRVRERFVVIDRGDLPSAYEVVGGVKVHPDFFPPPERADQYLRIARRYLAAHEHYAANPPEDKEVAGKVRDIRSALARVVGPHAPHGHLDEAARLIVKALS